MENDRNKIKEPYAPENTPNPPQIIDPSRKKEEEQGKQVKGEKADAAKERPQQQKGHESKKAKRLGESEPDIDDETTI